jgi:tetratricopeptide (TPR) repeat protein
VATVEGSLVLETARTLILAGQWDLADRLLASAASAEAAERAALALLRAQVAVEIRQWRGTGDPAAAVDAAAALIEAAGHPELAFDLDLLRLFRDYWAEMMPGGGTPPHFGPEGRAPAVLDELRDRAARLVATAPGGRRAARAAFYAGLVADNLRGEPDRAGELFGQALAACRPGADDDYAAEALRHLGGQAQDTGDLGLARSHWERSAGLAQRAGWLPLALAQQALLAELTAAEGDLAGAGALARETGRWAGALGLGRLEAQATAVAAQAAAAGSKP